MCGPLENESECNLVWVFDKKRKKCVGGGRIERVAGGRGYEKEGPESRTPVPAHPSESGISALKRTPPHSGAGDAKCLHKRWLTCADVSKPESLS